LFGGLHTPHDGVVEGCLHHCGRREDANSHYDQGDDQKMGTAKLQSNDLRPGILLCPAVPGSMGPDAIVSIAGQLPRRVLEQLRTNSPKISLI
jgi:hypothetical protein